jgi:hypothetical protein
MDVPGADDGVLGKLSSRREVLHDAALFGPLIEAPGELVRWATNNERAGRSA